MSDPKTVPFVAGVIYSCTTPLGIAVGLGIRETWVLHFTTTEKEESS